MRCFFLRSLVVLAGCCLFLVGCLGPRKQPDPTRSYILTPLTVEPGTAADASRGIPLGIAPVEIPSYLLGNALVFRKGDSEVRYSETHRWAERLDKGVQRVLGANLALLLGSDRIELSAWLRQSVKAELYVSIHRFECDEQGQVVLEARWRLAGPGGEPTLLARSSRIVRQTSAPVRQTEAAVAELSHALADLSREIAEGATRVSAP